MLNSNIIIDIQTRKESFQTALVKWYRTHSRTFPWRKNKTPYSVLIAEVLLKRTTAPAVKNVYNDFLHQYPNVIELAKADPKALESFLSKLGYHKLRTKILIEMANYIIEKYAGQVPNEKQQLLDIPHVGNYTANAILTFSYNIPAAIVDTNVERILKRVFFNNAPKGTSLKLLQEIADTLMPKKANQSYNYALLDLGGTVCVSGLPRCNLCPISAICDYYLSKNPKARCS